MHESALDSWHQRYSRIDVQSNNMSRQAAAMTAIEDSGQSSNFGLEDKIICLAQS